MTNEKQITSQNTNDHKKDTQDYQTFEIVVFDQIPKTTVPDSNLSKPKSKFLCNSCTII